MTRDSQPWTFSAQENGSSPIQFAPAQPAETSSATAQDGARNPAPPAGGSPWTFWLMLLLLFGFMWFFVIRPESRRRKQQQSFHSSLKKGDDVVTIGGMHGEIAAIEGNVVTLKVADSLRLKFDRHAIARSASTPQEAAPPAK